MVTALEGCEKYCKDFQVEQIELFQDNEKYIREFRCKHYNKCLALLEVLMKANYITCDSCTTICDKWEATVKAENL